MREYAAPRVSWPQLITHAERWGESAIVQRLESDAKSSLRGA
jgi:hypothetical protein